MNGSNKYEVKDTNSPCLLLSQPQGAPLAVQQLSTQRLAATQEAPIRACEPPFPHKHPHLGLQDPHGAVPGRHHYAWQPGHGQRGCCAGCIGIGGRAGGVVGAWRALHAGLLLLGGACGDALADAGVLLAALGTCDGTLVM